jgi:5-methylcytosine-specific restriction protein A
MSKNILYRKIINTQRWRDCRERQLRRRPLCEKCEREGRISCAEEVHHIRPIESVKDFEAMKSLAYDESNLMSLCRKCHHDIHAEMLSHSKYAAKENARRQTEHFFAKFLKCVLLYILYIYSN